MRKKTPKKNNQLQIDFSPKATLALEKNVVNEVLKEPGKIIFFENRSAIYQRILNRK